MTGQSPLTPAQSDEIEVLHAGSQQPQLQPKAADAASQMAWEALTALRTKLADHGHGPAPPASATLYDDIFKQTTLDLPGTYSCTDDERYAVHLQLLQNPHLLQLLDRALCGKLERTDQEYDPDYSPSLLHNIIKTEFEPDPDSARRSEQVCQFAGVCKASRLATGGSWDLVGHLMGTGKHKAIAGLIQRDASLGNARALIMGWNNVCNGMRSKAAAAEKPTASFTTASLNLVLDNPVTSLYDDLLPVLPAAALEISSWLGSSQQPGTHRSGAEPPHEAIKKMFTAATMLTVGNSMSLTDAYTQEGAIQRAEITQHLGEVQAFNSKHLRDYIGEMFKDTTARHNLQRSMDMLYKPKGGDTEDALFNLFDTYAKELGRTATYCHSACPAADIFVKARAEMAQDGPTGANLLKSVTDLNTKIPQLEQLTFVSRARRQVAQHKKQESDARNNGSNNSGGGGSGGGSGGRGGNGSSSSGGGNSGGGGGNSGSSGGGGGNGGGGGKRGNAWSGKPNAKVPKNIVKYKLVDHLEHDICLGYLVGQGLLTAASGQKKFVTKSRRVAAISPTYHANSQQIVEAFKKHLADGDVDTGGCVDAHDFDGIKIRYPKRPWRVTGKDAFMCRIACTTLSQKRLVTRFLLLLNGAKVLRNGMPDVTYYVWANAGTPPELVATPGQCYFKVAFDGSGDYVSGKVKIDEWSCINLIYESMMSTYDGSHGVTEDGEVRWGVCEPAVEMEGDTPTGRICFTVGTGKDEITEDTFLKGLKSTNVGQYNNRTFYDDSFKTKLSWSRASVTVQAGSAPVPVRIGFAPGPKLAKNLPPPKILKATENYDDKPVFDFNDDKIVKTLRGAGPAILWTLKRMLGRHVDEIEADADKLRILTDKAILLIGLSPPDDYRPQDALKSIRERGRQVLEEMTGTSTSSDSSDDSDDGEITTEQLMTVVHFTGHEFPALEFETRFLAALADFPPESVARTKPAACMTWLKDNFSAITLTAETVASGAADAVDAVSRLLPREKKAAAVNVKKSKLQLETDNLVTAICTAQHSSDIVMALRTLLMVRTGHCLQEKSGGGCAATRGAPVDISPIAVTRAWAEMLFDVAPELKEEAAIEVIAEFDEQLKEQEALETARQVLQHLQRPEISPDDTEAPAMLERLALAAALLVVIDVDGVDYTLGRVTCIPDARHNWGLLSWAGTPPTYDSGGSSVNLPPWVNKDRVNVDNPLVTVELMEIDGHVQLAGEKLLVELQHLALPGRIAKAAWEAHLDDRMDNDKPNSDQGSDDDDDDDGEDDDSNDDDDDENSGDTMSEDDSSPVQPPTPTQSGLEQLAKYFPSDLQAKLDSWSALVEISVAQTKCDVESDVAAINAAVFWIWEHKLDTVAVRESIIEEAVKRSYGVPGMMEDNVSLEDTCEKLTALETGHVEEFGDGEDVTAEIESLLTEWLATRHGVGVATSTDGLKRQANAARLVRSNIDLHGRVEAIKLVAELIRADATAEETMTTLWAEANGSNAAREQAQKALNIDGSVCDLLAAIANGVATRDGKPVNVSEMLTEMASTGGAMIDDLGTLEQLAATEVPPLPLLELATTQDQTVAELALTRRELLQALDKKGDGPDLFVVPVKGRKGEESCYILFSRRWENPNARTTTAMTHSETKNKGKSANDLDKFSALREHFMLANGSKQTYELSILDVTSTGIRTRVFKDGSADREWIGSWKTATKRMPDCRTSVLLTEKMMKSVLPLHVKNATTLAFWRDKAAAHRWCQSKVKLAIKPNKLKIVRTSIASWTGPAKTASNASPMATSGKRTKNDDRPSPAKMPTLDDLMPVDDDDEEAEPPDGAAAETDNSDEDYDLFSVGSAAATDSQPAPAVADWAARQQAFSDLDCGDDGDSVDGTDEDSDTDSSEEDVDDDNSGAPQQGWTSKGKTRRSNRLKNTTSYARDASPDRTRSSAARAHGSPE